MLKFAIVVETSTQQDKLFSRGPRSILGRIQTATQGVDMRPSYDHYPATAALLTSTDRLSESTVTEARMTSPDGYLIGIGAGGIFGLLDFFPEDNAPLGIVMIDIDPHVVAVGRALIDRLKTAQEPTDIQAFLNLDGESYSPLRTKVLKRDPVLREMTIGRWHTSAKKSPNSNPFCDYRDGISPAKQIVKHFDLLRELAKRGRIVAINSDFLYPELAQAISTLPGYSDSRNVIYLTNALKLAIGSRNQILGLDKIDQSDVRQLFSALAFYGEGSESPLLVHAPNFSSYLRIDRNFDDLIGEYRIRYPRQLESSGSFF